MPIEKPTPFTLSNVALSIGSSSRLLEEEKKRKADEAEYERRREVEFGRQMYSGYKELFQKNFLGFELLDSLFTLPDGTKLFEVSEQVKEYAYQMLYRKFHVDGEGEIGVWMDKINSGYNGMPKDEFKHWLLIYHPDASMRTNLANPKERGPISIQSLRNVVDGGLQQQGKRTKFVRHIWEGLENESWTKTPLTPGWRLVTRELILETRYKNIEQKNRILQGLPQDRYFEPQNRASRSPVDIVFDCALAQASKTPHLSGSQWGYEWTQQQTDPERIVNGENVGGRSAGRFVSVGDADVVGASVDAFLPSVSFPHLGSCLSR